MKPTRAAIEFDGDCFSRAHDPSVKECKMCTVNVQCSVKSLKRGIETMDEPVVRMPRLLSSTRSCPPRASSATGSVRSIATEIGMSVYGEFAVPDVLAIFLAACRNAGIRPGKRPEQNIRAAMQHLVKAGKLIKVGKFHWRPNENR